MTATPMTDGRVWVLADDHLYVITPEAVAATE